MAIDISALRRFQDMWEPVMKAIPAVMELDAKQADMDRWVATKKRELETAQKEIDAAYVEADVRLLACNKQMEDAVAKTNAAKAEFAELRRTESERLEAATEAAVGKLADVEAKIVEKTAHLGALGGEIAQALAAATAEREAAIAALNVTIKTLEARQASAEKTLDSLRAKLG